MNTLPSRASSSAATSSPARPSWDVRGQLGVSEPVEAALRPDPEASGVVFGQGEDPVVAKPFGDADGRPPGPRETVKAETARADPQIAVAIHEECGDEPALQIGAHAVAHQLSPDELEEAVPGSHPQRPARGLREGGDAPVDDALRVSDDRSGLVSIHGARRGDPQASAPVLEEGGRPSGVPQDEGWFHLGVPASLVRGRRGSRRVDVVVGSDPEPVVACLEDQPDHSPGQGLLRQVGDELPGTVEMRLGDTADEQVAVRAPADGPNRVQRLPRAREDPPS